MPRKRVTPKQKLVADLRVIADAEGLLKATAAQQGGNDVLGQIFGSRDVSRTVARIAATQSGLDPFLLNKMLAMMVVGFMAKQRGAGAGAQPAAAGGGLGGLPGASSAARAPAARRRDWPRCST